MEKLIEDGTERINGKTDDFRSKLQTAQQEFDRVSHETSNKIARAANEVVNTTSDSIERGRVAVRQYPIRSVAIAAASGVAAGCIMTLFLRRQ